MQLGIYRAIDASLVQKLRYDSIANNLANIGTAGHKKDFISFDQALSHSYRSEVDHTQGAIRHTGGDLDLAIENVGFFKVMTPEGVRYTRNGGFALNAEGVLTTKSGDPVMGGGGPVRIAGGPVVIDDRGRIVVDEQAVDQLSIVDFDSLPDLEKRGRGYFFHPEGADAERRVDRPVIHQGYIEQSNVDPTTEMVKMIETYRAFESNHNAIQSLDEMTRKLVNNYAMQQ